MCKGCLVCLGDTQYVYLFGSKKLVYMRSQRFLPPSHRYRKMSKEFDGTEKKGRAPKHLDGKLVLELVKNIKVVFGKKVPKGKENTKKRKKTTEIDDQTKKTGHHEEDATGFKMLSIFFKYLPYWKDLDIRHAIAVMHVEKNVCDSILGILLDIKGKTKEGLKSRKDFVDLNIRHELHPEERANGRYHLPTASYNLTTDEKKAICKCLRGVRVPTGYSSNIKNLVSMKDLKLVGMKSHDYHVMMTQMLPIAIRCIKPDYVKLAVTRLCHFFNTIAHKVIDPAELSALIIEIAETLCLLEMVFLLSLFDMIVHLLGHIMDEIKILGLVL